MKEVLNEEDGYTDASASKGSFDAPTRVSEIGIEGRGRLLKCFRNWDLESEGSSE